jgi:hypothetical protein
MAIEDDNKEILQVSNGKGRRGSPAESVVCR